MELRIIGPQPRADKGPMRPGHLRLTKPPAGEDFAAPRLGAGCFSKAYDDRGGGKQLLNNYLRQRLSIECL